MLTGLLSAILLLAQAPAFEVASIKRNTSASQSASIRAQPGGRITITNTTLFMLIRNAYSREAFQITDGPGWLSTDRWDIVARAPGDADQATVLTMAKTLLADRFRLVVHTESRDMPIYALVRDTARLGTKLTPSTADCPKTLAEVGARDARARSGDAGSFCGVDVSPGRLTGSARTMSDIARVLSPLAGRMVVDKTGLIGEFDLELTWGDAADGPSLFTAIREQLGLKLESQRGPVEVLVIDSAERPTDD